MSSQTSRYPLKTRILRAILKFRMRLSELVAYGAFWFLPEPRKGHHKVFIFGQGRTGSTLLESLISSGINFTPRGEILSPAMIIILRPLEYVLGRYKLANENFIFHVKPYHFFRGRKKRIDPKAFISALQKRGWKMIYLRRENKLMHGLSNIVAENRGAYHKMDDRDESLLIEIDMDKLERYVTNRIINSEKEIELLAGFDFVEVVYERDLQNAENHQKTADRVFDFVGLPSVAVQTKLRKVNAKSLRETFSNYDELIACVVRNGWTHFLPAEDREKIS